MQSLSPDYSANIALRQSQQAFAELWLRNADLAAQPLFYSINPEVFLLLEKRLYSVCARRRMSGL